MPATVTPHNYVTTDDLQKFGDNLRKQIVEEIVDVFKDYVAYIDERFNRIGARLDRVEERLTRVETRLTKVEVRLGEVEIRLDNVEVRLNNAAVKLDKLEAGQVSINNTLQNLSWD